MLQLPSFLVPDRRNRIVYFTFFISLCYLASLVSSIQPGVFFSSDGGMKFLVVKQLVQGQGFKYMYLPQPQWVHEIWNNGYFPFNEPFVYPAAHGYLFSFPPAFQIVSAFFYAKFGYIGLYVLPIISALLLWIFMWNLLMRCGLAPFKIAFGIFMLVLCSPLTIYASTYWEHVPAVLLLFPGIVYLIKPPAGLLMAVLMGFLCGLAVWLRPEALIMDILYALALGILYLREKQFIYPAFLTGMFLSIAVFFVFNKMEYGSFFGIHGYQVLNEPGFVHELKNKGEILISINKFFIRYFPFVLLLLPILYLFFKSKELPGIRLVLLLGIVIAYCLFTPFILPNPGGRQWGPRYFLPLIPVIVVLLLLIEEELELIRARRLPIWVTTVLIVFAGYSFYLNTYKGGIKQLRWENYHRIRPSLDFIRQNGNVVITNTGFVAMEMAYEFNEKYFFLADGEDSLKTLLSLLKKQGIHEFTYVFDVYNPKGYPNILKTSPIHFSEKADFYFSKYIIK